MNRTADRVVRFKQPIDRHSHMFQTYIARNLTNSEKLCMIVIRCITLAAVTVLTNRANHLNKHQINKITPAHTCPAEEMISLLSGSNNLTSEIAGDCDKMYALCNIWASTRKPGDIMKVSTSHANETLNNLGEANFLVTRIKGILYQAISTVELGTTLKNSALLLTTKLRPLPKILRRCGLIVA